MKRHLLAAFLGAGTSVPASSYLAIDAAPAATPPAVLSEPPEPSTAPPEGSAKPLPAPLAVLVNIHTGESLRLDEETPTVAAFSVLLEDRITGSRVAMDAKLIELLRKVARRHDSPRIELVSGYRSPKLNEMLRKKERKVASHSQHSLGHAVDFRIVGMTAKDMRKELEALAWVGGIGQYDRPSDQFVHADTGPNRRWRERLRP